MVLRHPDSHILQTRLIDGGDVGLTRPQRFALRNIF
jgi:hypothetical protein